MTDVLLYVATVLVWGFSWYAIKLQLGSVAPEVSIIWRFALAAAIMVAWAWSQRTPLRLNQRQHAGIALLGGLLYSGNFVLLYAATAYLPSGLVSVLFSTIVILNIFNGRLILGLRTTPVVWAGALLGLTGITIVFWRDLAAFRFGTATMTGLLFCLAGTYLASVGNCVAARIQKLKLTVVQANVWGMGYGLLFLTLFALSRGTAFTFDPGVTYVAALLYLAVFASVVGFTCYLTLLARIGPERAAYSSVLSPLVALVVSATLEGMPLSATTLIGGLVVLAGNVLVLAGPRALAALSPRRNPP